MLNVRDECDLPDDDGYDLFTRETEFERHAKHPQLGTIGHEGEGGWPGWFAQRGETRWRSR